MPPTHDISQMSNRELGEMLKDYGITAGPIVGSTRKIYEKRLVQCMTGVEIQSRHAPVTDSDDDDDDDDEDDVAPSPAFLQQERSGPRRRVMRDETDQPLHQSYNYSPKRNRSPMKFTSTPLPSDKDPNTKTSPNSTSSGIPIWIKLLLMLILVIIAYLVVQNMESSEDNEIPRGIEAEV